MKRLGILAAVISFAVTLATVVVISVQADSVPPLLTEYPVPGNPHHVVVESPGRVWFTLPDQNMIGRLTVTSTLEYEVLTYTVPTANSEPYDLDYADGAVWFTERTGNNIGRLDPTTGVVHEFPIQTAASQPTGIDVVAGSPTQVWFTEQAGNKLGQLVVTSTADYSWNEYSLPDAFPDAQLQDLYVQDLDRIWFTAPGVSRIGRLRPSQGPDGFDLIYPNGGGQPWAIEVDSEGYPWFTDVGTNGIGQFFPQTLSMVSWYMLPQASSGPYGIAISQGLIWFTERDGHRVGQLDPTTRSFREFGLPGGRPLGLAVDGNGHVWIAESASGKIARWQPPYFRFAYLPLVLRNG